MGATPQEIWGHQRRRQSLTIGASTAQAVRRQVLTLFLMVSNHQRDLHLHFDDAIHTFCLNALLAEMFCRY